MKPHEISHAKRFTQFLPMLAAVMLLAGCQNATGPIPPADTPPPGADAVTEADPSWYVCEQDNDCMAVEGTCASWSAVNRNFVGPFTVNRNAMNDQMGCSEAEAPATPPPGVGCIETRCTVKPEEVAEPGPPSADY